MTATETAAAVIQPLAGGPVLMGRICDAEEDGSAIEDTCQDIYADTTTAPGADPGDDPGDDGPPPGTGPGEGTPGPGDGGGGGEGGGGGDGSEEEDRGLDSDGNSMMDSWREVVASGKSCGYNFTEDERLGAPRGGGSRTHQGVDFGANKGDEVRALHSGTVTVASTGTTACGLQVTIVNRDLGWETRYCHLDTKSVGVGSTVSAGDPIGGAGRSGLGYDEEEDGDPPNIGVHAHIEHTQNAANKPFYEVTDTAATATNLVDKKDGGC